MHFRASPTGGRNLLPIDNPARQRFGKAVGGLRERLGLSDAIRQGFGQIREMNDEAAFFVCFEPCRIGVDHCRPGLLLIEVSHRATTVIWRGAVAELIFSRPCCHCSLPNARRPTSKNRSGSPRSSARPATSRRRSTNCARGWKGA